MSTENTGPVDEQAVSPENVAPAEETNTQDNKTEETTEVTRLKDELSQERDKFLRLFAEFENFKKRNARERLELLKTASQDVMLALLPILDDFDRAIVEISKHGENALAEGVVLIHDKFKNTLASKGLEEVVVAAGDAFNADFAEAITQIPAPSEDLKGKVVDVVEKGYKLGDKIIRYPKVVTGA